MGTTIVKLGKVKIGLGIDGRHLRIQQEVQAADGLLSRRELERKTSYDFRTVKKLISEMNIISVRVNDVLAIMEYDERGERLRTRNGEGILVDAVTWNPEVTALIWWISKR